MSDKLKEVFDFYSSDDAFKERPDHKQWYRNDHIDVVERISRRPELAHRAPKADPDLTRQLIAYHDIEKAVHNENPKISREETFGKFQHYRELDPGARQDLHTGLDYMERIKKGGGSIWGRIGDSAAVASTADALSHYTNGPRGFLNIYSNETNPNEDMEVIKASNQKKLEKDKKKMNLLTNEEKDFRLEYNGRDTTTHFPRKTGQLFSVGGSAMSYNKQEDKYRTLFTRKNAPAKSHSGWEARFNLQDEFSEEKLIPIFEKHGIDRWSIFGSAGSSAADNFGREISISRGSRDSVIGAVKEINDLHGDAIRRPWVSSESQWENIGGARVAFSDGTAGDLDTVGMRNGLEFSASGSRQWMRRTRDLQFDDEAGINQLIKDRGEDLKKTYGDNFTGTKEETRWKPPIPTTTQPSPLEKTALSPPSSVASDPIAAVTNDPSSVVGKVDDPIKPPTKKIEVMRAPSGSTISRPASALTVSQPTPAAATPATVASTMTPPVSSVSTSPSAIKPSGPLQSDVPDLRLEPYKTPSYETRYKGDPAGITYSGLDISGNSNWEGLDPTPVIDDPFRTHVVTQGAPYAHRAEVARPGHPKKKFIPVFLPEPRQPDPFRETPITEGIPKKTPSLMSRLPMKSIGGAIGGAMVGRFFAGDEEGQKTAGTFMGAAGGAGFTSVIENYYKSQNSSIQANYLSTVKGMDAKFKSEQQYMAKLEATPINDPRNFSQYRDWREATDRQLGVSATDTLGPVAPKVTTTALAIIPNRENVTLSKEAAMGIRRDAQAVRRTARTNNKMVTAGLAAAAVVATAGIGLSFSGGDKSSGINSKRGL